MNSFPGCRWPVYLPALTVLLLLSGCGSSEPTGDVVATVPASGVLTYKGDPLAYYKVIVMPEDGGRPAMGITNEAGEFVLGTNDVEDGAVVGTHPVAISYVGPPSDNPEEGIMEFNDPPPPKVKIAKKYENPATSDLTATIPEEGTSVLFIEVD